MALGRELPQSFQEALQLAARLLSRSPQLVEKNLIATESEQIVLAAYRKATGKSLTRIELMTRIQDRLPAAAGEAVIVFASARAEGRLLQHVIGYQTFLDHEYEVGPDVLVPRPETEVLVSHAIEELQDPVFGLEIGAGSGAISIELLTKFPALTICASELTGEAEARALSNARRILNSSAGDSARLQLVRAQSALDVWEPFERAKLSKKAQFLISNPPYLAGPSEADPEVLQNEPATALFGSEKDPVHFYREIARGASRFLEPGSPVFLEIPHERAAVIEGLFALEGWKVRLLKDLHGRDRVLSAKL